VRVDLQTKKVALTCGWDALDGKPANLAVSEGYLLAATTARSVSLTARGDLVAAVPSDAKVAARLLGDRHFETRQRASAVLVGLGETARPELEAASQSADPETRLRALDAIDAIERHARRLAWLPRIKEDWLKDDKGLLDRLTHPSAELRLAAVRQLGLIKDDDVNVLLLDLLKDKDPTVEGAAAVALLLRGDRTGIELVAKVLEVGSLEQRKAAIDALRQKGSAADLPLLQKAATDDDAEVRGASAAAALAVAGEKALPLATKLLDDKEEKVRADLEAALINGKLAVDVVCPLFRKLANDAQRGIRQVALDQLGRPEFRHKPDAIGAFADRIDDADETVQRKAFTYLVNLDPVDGAYFPHEKVEKAFDQPGLQDNDRFHLVQVAETCIAGGGAFAIAPLAKTALAAQHPVLRERALSAALDRAQLAEPLTAQDVMAVGSLTLASDVNVRLDGYKILAVGHGPGRGLALLKGLADQDEKEKDLVRRSLPVITDTEVLAELVRREATAENAEEQAAAAAALDYRADDKKEALAPVFLEALADKDERVRARAWKRVRDLAQADEDLGFFEPGAKPDERAPSVRRAAAWWWRRGHAKDVESFVKELAGQGPAARWKAAKKLVDLATPCFKSLATDKVIDAIAKAASDEREEYVLRQELAVVAALTGKPCAVKEGASAEERARAVKVAVEWRK
jgi:HEAT repeat protein